MTDYSTLIDAETWAFIEKTNSFYPPDAVEMTVAEQRAVYDRMCQAFHAGHPEGLSMGTGWFEQREPHIRMRVYRPKAENAPAVVLYLHGGGFVVGGLESHDDVCAEIAARTGFDVLAVDYRLAPEHQHPAAFDDAMAVFEWLLSRSLPVLLCGDSAGGNLAAALAAAGRKNERRALGQVLIYPGLGGDVTTGSYVTHADAPMLSTRDVLFYHHVRGAAAGDPTAAPLANTDFSGLPPTVVITAECDPLSSDGETYRDRILAAGGRALWIEELGLVHGYLRARHSVARARDSFTRIVDALSALGRGEWPADLARQKP
jgi:acetyl esterase